MECVIEKKAEKVKPITQGERDFANIMNKPEPERHPKYYYRHKITHTEYSWIEGAFAPPGYQYPGFAIVIASDRNLNGHEHFIRVLEEFETEHQNDIQALVKGCVALKKKYGDYPVLQQGFYSELDEASSDKVSNVIFELYGEESKFYPISGPYSEHGNPFQQYLMTLAHYKRILDVSQAPRLKTYMLMLKKGKDLLGLKPEDNPAVAAIAYAVSAMVHKKPWQFQPEDSAFNFEDEY